MTLIAFAVHRDRAEIITDTRTYTHTATRMGHTSKVMLLPHMDAAVLAQGSTGFERRWHMQALYLAQQTADFDDFTRQAPEHLAFVWNEMAADAEAENARHGRSASVANSVVFLIGYSTEQQAFKAYGYASDDDFEPMDQAGLHVMPSPLNVRPSKLELRRLRLHLGAALGLEGVRVVNALAQKPPPPVPAKPAQWVGLAKAVRRDRALADIYSGLKTYVGGDVIHTTVQVGSATNHRVHTFDDAGPEFTRMMAGSLHPLGQAAPCDCGSGRQFVACCLAAIADEPCPCQSGTPFADCCSIRAGSDAAVGPLVGAGGH